MLSSQAAMGSLKVLKCPVRPAAAVQPRPSLVQYHYEELAHSQRQGSHPFTRQLLHPFPVDGVHLGGWGGGKERLSPTPGEPALLLLTHSDWQWGRGNPISCFPARELPSRGSPRSRVRGCEALLRKSLFMGSSSRRGLPGDRTCQCAGKSAQLLTVLPQKVSGCGDPARRS